MKHVRFKFWKIFWAVVGIYLFFTLLGVIIAILTPPGTTEFNLEKLSRPSYISNQLFSFFFTVLFYYYTLNSYYDLFSKKTQLISFLKPTVIAFIVSLIYFYFSFKFFGAQNTNIRVNDREIKDLPLELMVFADLVSTFFLIGVSLLVSYLFYLRDEKKQRKILEEQKMQLEIEKSQANLNFLKAQINPHFLHNTLNFFYAKALPLSAELSEGILTLSEIMRYALSEANAKEGKALLKDEIEHVRNVIKIQQLRFNNRLNVQMEVEGIVNGATIVPFVLITLVENAFKHGELKDMHEPISIKLKVEKGSLYFYCRNKKKKGPKELSTGIGLSNIKKRLDLTYGQHYSLRVKDDSDYYTTELIVDRL